jgi:hypothetical protein
MNEEIPNIEVIRSVWRRVRKPIKIPDLKPVKDVKGSSGVAGKSKPTTDVTGAACTTGSH